MKSKMEYATELEDRPQKSGFTYLDLSGKPLIYNDQKPHEVAQSHTKRPYRHKVSAISLSKPGIPGGVEPYRQFNERALKYGYTFVGSPYNTQALERALVETLKESLFLIEPLLVRALNAPRKNSVTERNLQHSGDLCYSNDYIVTRNRLHKAESYEGQEIETDNLEGVFAEAFSIPKRHRIKSLHVPVFRVNSLLYYLDREEMLEAVKQCFKCS